jgi:pyruvate dehydrogenase E1 component alpha subunit
VVGEQAFLGSAGYRTEAEIESWKKKCPIMKFERFVLEGGKVGKDELDRIVNEAQTELEAAIEFSRKAALPDPAEVTDDVYA